MKNTDLKPLATILGSAGLARLADQAAAHRTLTERVRALLPPAEAAHLVAAHRDRSEALVVAMDSPAWAARVRYMTATLDTGPVRVTVVPHPEAGI